MLAKRIGYLSVWDTVSQVLTIVAARMSQALATHLADACSRATSHIPLQGCICVCTIDGQPLCMALKPGITVSSRILSKVCTSCRCFSSTRRTSECAGARAWRWTAAVLATSTQQVGPTSHVRLDARTHSLHWVGIHCRRLSRPNTSQNASIRGGFADARRPLGQRTGVQTLCQHPAGDNADRCGDELRRSRHTVVIRLRPNDAIVARVETQQLQLGADHVSLDRVLGTLDGRLVRKRQGSAAVSRGMALLGTIRCRGVPPEPHIMSGVRSRRTRFLQGPTAAGSIDHVGK